ncbi:MAG: flagellar assembly protein FliW [Clostridiales bacterium]|nr:flagellar assembly protein FliW [Clostridiales bacterium]
MRIQTKDYGVCEIDDKEVIHFKQGILGFEDVREYAILRRNDSPVLRLQSISGENPRFVVFEPEQILAGYKPKMPSEVLKILETDDASDLQYFLIAVVPNVIKDMTVNLKSPIVVNLEKRLAMQVVLDGTEYSMRHRVFEGKAE